MRAFSASQRCELKVFRRSVRLRSRLIHAGLQFILGSVLPTQSVAIASFYPEKFCFPSVHLLLPSVNNIS
jgi:hypothetical protein